MLKSIICLVKKLFYSRIFFTTFVASITRIYQYCIKTNDGYRVTKTKLSSKKYDRLKEIFSGLNMNGRTSAVQKVVDAKAQKHLEQLQNTWRTIK